MFGVIGNIIHKLANLLRLSHEEMIAAKLKAREQVAKGKGK